MTRRLRIADLATFAVPSQPALSPDGREVVYVLTTVDTAGDENVTSLWRADTGGRRPASQLTRGTADSAPAWSPDGSTIAFLRADGGPAQLWLLPARGGEPEQVTALPLGVVATPTSYGEVVTVEVATGAETVLTAHGTTPEDDVELYVRQEREFAISDGSTVQGWLIRDPDAAGPGPVLLDTPRA